VTPDPILRSPADKLALNQFRELAQAWAPFFRTELQIAVALRDCAGNWHLVFGFTGFAPEQTTPQIQLEVPTASIRAYRRTRHLDSTEALAAVRQTLQRPGIAEFSDIEASVAAPNNQVIAFERNFLARNPGPIRSPALIIYKDGTGNEAFPSVEQLDHELLTAKQPFDGLADLLNELAVPDVNQILSSCRAEIVVFPLPVCILLQPASHPLKGPACNRVSSASRFPLIPRYDATSSGSA
jgi:hypothetical protein